ncbi:MAG: Nramp family divalent metal transporter [Clostridia bacterium]|jgi:NRAMP (natural resistance-associated macrophage protein)-like metal ion transporter|nr:Nramp family divalent metal transporter [Clostridia bacterium]
METKPKKTFLERLKEVGPGALVAAAFIGPGTVTSCSTSGASFGYTLLWAMLFSVISVIVMQTMAAKLGIVKQMGLGEALRTIFVNKAVRILLAILVISAVFIGNVAYETGNISGSVLGLQAISSALDTKVWKIILALILGAIAFILLVSGSYKSIEKVLTGLVVIMGVIFLICAICAKPDWGAVLKGLFIPSVPSVDRAWMTVAALMGTTVVPYNIYLHASSAAKKWKDPETDLKTSMMDSIIAIGLGGVISIAIIVCAAATINATGGSIKSGADMAKALTPLLGSWATVIFGIGLFAAGFTSAITAPLAAAFASSGILGWGEDMKKNRFKVIWLVVLLFGVVAVCTLGASPTEIILFAQAANAFLLPITAILLLVVCNNKNVMGKYKNGVVLNILAVVVIAVFLFIAARNMTAFVTSVKALFTSAG